MLTDDPDQSRSAWAPLGPAAVMWNDFVGSAAADQPAARDDTELYALAGLDPERWIVLAVDLVLHGTSEHALVYALDRREHGIGTQDQLLELAYDTGELPVEVFDVAHPTESGRSTRSVFDRIAVRLVARGVSDQRLVVHPRP